MAAVEQRARRLPPVITNTARSSTGHDSSPRSTTLSARAAAVAPIGAGPVMAHAAGAELANLELCQFRPTALAAPGSRYDGLWSPRR